MIEFRADGQALMLDYAGQCGGRGSYTYPQQELVAACAGELEAAGGERWFGVAATGPSAPWKTDLDIRPTWQRTEDRIRAHVFLRMIS